MGLMKGIKANCEKEKVHEILRYAEACSLRDYLILKVPWESGLRVSELAALTPGDLEPHSQVLKTVKAEGGKRRIPIDGGTLKMLSDYIFTSDISIDRPIFNIKRWQVHAIIKKYGKMIRLDVHHHTFRHSFAIHLVRFGVDIRRLQLLLGHSNLNTTQVYLRFKDEDLREGTTK
jgi:integrase/recombinase XerD